MLQVACLGPQAAVQTHGQRQREYNARYRVASMVCIIASTLFVCVQQQSIAHSVCVHVSPQHIPRQSQSDSKSCHWSSAPAPLIRLGNDSPANYQPSASSLLAPLLRDLLPFQNPEALLCRAAYAKYLDIVQNPFRQRVCAATAIRERCRTTLHCR
jgi:hypothetical protein